MTDNYDDIATEESNTPYEYGKKGLYPRYQYKVWNPNPQKLDVDPTPGIIMRKTITNADKSRDVTYSHADKLNVVILFSSPGRKLGRGNGAAFKVVCESADGENPSLKIKEPLCRKVETNDLVQIFSQWKGYDQAKVDAQIQDVTDGTGKLQICGLKSKGGFITLCKYARKDPDTGTPGACQQNLQVVAYDLDNKHEFSMQLTGRTISYGKFIAPIHEFFQFLAQNGPQGKSLPSYAFTVELSALPNGQYYLLGVKNWKKIEDLDVRNDMKDRALRIKERYDKQSNYIPDEPKVEAPVQEPVKTNDYKQQKLIEATKVESPTKTVALSAVGEVSFDDDDINF